MKTGNSIRFIFPAMSVNEQTSRAVVSAFLVQADPTIEELADIRTAVSEAVTNSIVHGYRSISGEVELYVDEKLGAMVKSSTMSGKFSSDKPHTTGEIYTFGLGEIEIEVETVSGNLKIY